MNALVRHAIHAIKVPKHQEDYEDDGRWRWRCGRTAEVVATELSKVFTCLCDPDAKAVPLHFQTFLADVEENIKVTGAVIVQIFPFGGDFWHDMIWVLTESHAHTLQSWITLVRPHAWSIPRGVFMTAIEDVTKKKRSQDATFRAAFETLTHVPAKFWSKKMRRPCGFRYFIAPLAAL